MLETGMDSRYICKRVQLNSRPLDKSAFINKTTFIVSLLKHMFWVFKEHF